MVGCGRASACVKLSTVMSQILITVDNFTQARARSQPTIGMYLYCAAVCRETCEKVYTIGRGGRATSKVEGTKKKGALSGEKKGTYKGKSQRENIQFF